MNNMLRKNIQKNKGFTLIELIVTIVILAVLIGVTIGGIFSYVQDARKNKGVYIANQLETALGEKFWGRR